MQLRRQLTVNQLLVCLLVQERLVAFPSALSLGHDLIFDGENLFILDDLAEDGALLVNQIAMREGEVIEPVQTVHAQFFFLALGPLLLQDRVGCSECLALVVPVLRVVLDLFNQTLPVLVYYNFFGLPLLIVLNLALFLLGLNLLLDLVEDVIEIAPIKHAALASKHPEMFACKLRHKRERNTRGRLRRGVLPVACLAQSQVRLNGGTTVLKAVVANASWVRQIWDASWRKS